MPYKPTGNPPGRPRKTEPVTPVVVDAQTEPSRLERAREGFKRGAFDPSTVLHRPPRFGQKRREVGRRPILHPNVIGKA